MFEEDDLLPLSALQHLLFCERRMALVHIEGLWAENLFTVEGSHLHTRSDMPNFESRGNIRIVRGLRLHSLRLGLSGKADVVEFHRIPDTESGMADQGVRLEGVSGIWRPFPVEYKRGKRRQEEGYEVQLCAQALCLEEMLGAIVPKGAIYFGKTARRFELSFDLQLRRKTVIAAKRLHELTREGKTPAARYEKKCKSCSIESLCLPRATGSRHSAAKYLSMAIADAAGGLREEMT